MKSLHDTGSNLSLPGNPRYQPQRLKGIFGYDNLYKTVGQVEIANLEVLAEIGVMPQSIAKLLTKRVKIKLLALTTSQIDVTERKITKHDIRAWIYEAQKVVPTKLGSWLHVLLTSYDVIDTGRILQFIQAHNEVVKPLIKELIRIMASLVKENAGKIQIGRTHGQHALPITVGFWLATILQRMLYNYEKMNQHAAELKGKISGAVGAYNAQLGFGVLEASGSLSYEERILAKLNLKAAPISTQILAPEPLAYYLYSAGLFSATLAQFGRDCRHLMRSEIAEIAEEFSSQQSGSSTMAHKRNPINFENLEGMWLRIKNELGKVQDTLISEHQRDLTGSSLYRDFPIIIVNLASQLETLLRKNEAGKSFLERIRVNEEACERNLEMNANVILSEPFYIALQIFGYTGDAHQLVNHVLVPLARRDNTSLFHEAKCLAVDDKDFAKAWNNIPEEIKSVLEQAQDYCGIAKQKALEIAQKASKILKRK